MIIADSQGLLFIIISEYIMLMTEVVINYDDDLPVVNKIPDRGNR